MARFTSTVDGRTAVNLDHVFKTVETDGKKTKLLSDDGTTLGHEYSNCFDPVAMTSPVVAARPGEQAICISVMDGDGRPTEVFVERLWIRAWRIDCVRRDAVPILDEECGEDSVFLEQPDGRILKPLSCSYKDIDQAKAEILRKAQEDWDRRENEKAHSR
jgi:hypothetical protein